MAWYSAMLLQQSVEYLNLMQWEYPARAGEYVIKERRRASKKSAEARKLIHADRNKKIIKDFKAGTPTSIIAKRHGIGVRYVQKLVKPYRQK